MKANRMWLFSDVLEKNKRVFKVPVYQRNYDWTNIQCEKLFWDIMKAGENNRQHFTGTVVYIDDVNGGSGLNEVLIIDGQQRITTMYILLKALYDIPSLAMHHHFQKHFKKALLCLRKNI